MSMQQDAKATTPLMQRVKLQSEVLVPLLRHLRAELGSEKANALVYPVLRRCTKEWVTQLASSESENPVENFHRTSEMHSANYEGDVDREILKADSEHLDVDVVPREEPERP